MSGEPWSNDIVPDEALARQSAAKIETYCEIPNARWFVSAVTAMLSVSGVSENVAMKNEKRGRG